MESKITFLILTLCMAGFLTYVYGQAENQAVSDVCLGCICHAISDCNRTNHCHSDACGLFRITWAYWADSGKPTIGNESPDTTEAYVNCVLDPFCAARAVQGYMRKFYQDCNGDGIVDCKDYGALHKLGGYGCRVPLQDPYGSKLEQCLTQFG